MEVASLNNAAVRTEDILEDLNLSLAGLQNEWSSIRFIRKPSSATISPTLADFFCSLSNVGSGILAIFLIHLELHPSP
jgi:hypothetical protein